MARDYISDAALDAHYRRIWEEDRGWDPYEGPYKDDDDDGERIDTTDCFWVKPGERGY